MGRGLNVLQEARGEPGTGPVPEAVEQFGGGLQEDQGVGGAEEGRNGVVLGDEERPEEREEVAGVFR